MRHYFKNYQLEFQKKIDSKKVTLEDIEELDEKMRELKLERLIHLVITLAFVVFTLIFMALGMLSSLFLIPFFILIVFLLFYIRHYYFLENTMQSFYMLYDLAKKIIKQKQK